MENLLEIIKDLKNEDVNLFIDVYELCRFGADNYEIQLEQFITFSITFERILKCIDKNINL